MAQISFHSQEAQCSPRSRNRRMPRASLIWPKTGSTIGANPARLANPAAGSLGDHPLRKGACSGRGFYQIDMNLVKKVKITERLRFEFRAEFFNILNHVSFSFPSAPNINNSGFGTLTGTVSGPREMQFNGRISF
jgi:hypothetical protein